MFKYKKYLLLLAIFPFQIITNSCGGGSNFSLSAALKGPKLFYSDGEKITKDEFNVVAIYSDKTTKEINEWECDVFKDSDTYLFTTTDKEVGYKTFNFQYSGQTTSCNVTVKDATLDSIDAKLADSSKQFIVNDAIYKSDIVVTGYLSDGSTITIKEDYWKSDFFGEESSKILDTSGEKEIDISLPTYEKSAKLKIVVQEPAKPTYTITFDTLGGTTIDSQTVKYGGKVTRPKDNPTKESDTFDDWYTEKELTNKYNFDLSVSSNLTLYAGWKHKVIFNCEDKTEETFDSQLILDGRCANNPGLPTPKDIEKICYGWELNGETFDFSTPITKSIELKPRITETTQTDLNIEIYDSSSSNPIRELNIDGDYIYQIEVKRGTEKISLNDVDFKSSSGFVEIYDNEGKKELKIDKECSGGTDSIIAHAKINNVDHYGILQIEVASFDKIICYENKIKTRTGAQEETTGRVVIPSKHYINEKGWRNITEIGDDELPAFKGFNKITSVDILSNKITSIHKNTFQGCSSLTSISMPSSIKEISDYAFESSGLKKINLHENIINIGAYAFANNKNLDSISFPKSIESIGKYSFENCTKLDYAYIPETLKLAGINIGIFKGCSNLAEVKIDSQDMINARDTRNPFLINNAATIIVRKGIKVEKPSELYWLIDYGVVKRTTNDVIESQEGYVYYERSSGAPFLKAIDLGIGYSINKIKEKRFEAPEYAYVPTYFEHNGIIKKVISINILGFSDFTLSLKASCVSVHLPSSIVNFFPSAFSFTYKLVKVNVPRSLKRIPKFGFSFGILTNLYFDSNSQLESLANSAITGIEATTITLPDSVAYIDPGALYFNDKLKKLNIPKKVEQISFTNFWACNLNELIFDDPYNWTINGTEVIDVTDPGKNAALVKGASTKDNRTFVKKPINKIL